jgi:superfamily II DNA or RNA helicase
MRRNRRVLFVLPTGGGKTVCFSYIAARTAERGKRIVIMVHRDELVAQVSKTLESFGVYHGIIAAGYPETASNVQVASVFSLVRRIKTVNHPDLIIADEAHHCTTGNTWGKITEACNSSLLLGVSATPCRSDMQGLGDVFGEIVLGPTMAELIQKGRLSPYRIFAPTVPDMSGIHKRGGDYVSTELAAIQDKPSITGDALKYYRQLLDGKPTVAFCVSVEHCRHVAEAFRDGGYVAVSVDGTMEREERRKIMAEFAEGRINILTSCDLISEGFDVQGIMGAILLRPTQSLALYLQQVGRALRFVEGKTAIILDHAGNVMRHGLPDDHREWTLETTSIRQSAPKDPDDISIKQCPECFRIVRSVTMTCPECGHIWIPKPREVNQVEGELTEVDLSKRIARIEQGRAQDIESLIRLGHSPSRAAHIVQARAEKKAMQDSLIADIHAHRLSVASIGEIRKMKPKALRELREQVNDIIASR